SADNHKSNNVEVQGDTFRTDMHGAVADAIDASQEIAMLHATQQIDSLRGNQTIRSTGVINVIDVGDIKLDGSATLSLRGRPSDYFFINVHGKFAMTGNSSIDLRGVPSTHVIFNVLGTGEQ